MRVGILNPAPIGRNLTRWGDYHYGASLASAFEALGCEVVQQYWPEWDALPEVDVSITLRGKRPAPAPAPGVRVIWVISHPAAVSPGELNAYDLALVASETHRSRLQGHVEVPLHVLRQCTDPARFFTTQIVEDDLRQRRDLVFVANSRGIRRDVTSALAGLGAEFRIIGRHWKELGLQDRVRATYAEGEALRETYAACRAALNDHWNDMKFFGIANNRILDCLACGAPVLSDEFPELRSVFGDALLYVGNDGATGQALETLFLDYRGCLERARDYWARHGEDWSFEARAASILRLVDGLSPAGRDAAPPPVPPQAEDVLTAIERARAAKTKDAPVQVLHVNPSDGLRYWLAGQEGADTITAGFGSGPFLVDLSPDLGNFPEARFDLAVIEPGEGSDGPWREKPLARILEPHAQVLSL